MRPLGPPCGGARTLTRAPDLGCAIRANQHAKSLLSYRISVPFIPGRKAWPTTASATNVEASSHWGASSGIRINKCFKASHSRRQADVLVETGRVKLNGKVASPGDRVQPGDTVTLDGKPIKWTTHNEPTSKATSKEHVYIKYWKPKGIVCTTDRTIKGNVIDQIKHPKRVFMVGRLDKDTTGLLLLTDDGRLVNALLRSQHAHYKTYLVRVDRPLRVAALRNLRKGVTITTYAQRDGKSKALTAPTLPATVEQVDMQTFMITITEGRNRQIRKMCEAVGYKVIGLHREAVAGITLEGMKLGAWEEVARADRRIIERVLTSADQLIK